ncbi:MAG: tetratricopeptide repeat protein [Bacteroidetes bacterium]|nr:tetratricopeptide repeat protein [Bacteroidota bacterium]
MTHEQLQSLIDQAESENYKGHFAEAEKISNEVISFLRSNKLEDYTTSGLLLSRALCQLAFSFRKRGEGLGKESLLSAEEAYRLALEAGSPIDVTHAMMAIGGSHQYLSDYTLSLDWYAKALAMYEELGDTLGIAKIKLYSGITYKILGDYQRALQHYSESMSIFEELGATSLLADVTGELAYIYKIIGSLDIALEYYGHSLSLFKEIGYSRMIAGMTANIGAVYMEQKDSEKALEHFGNALSILEEIGEKHFKAVITWNIGVVYFGLLDYTAAMEYFKRSLAMYEHIDLQNGIATALGGVGELYANEMYEGYDAEKAEEYLLKSIAINDKLGLKAEYDQHIILTELYSKQKRWEEAFAMFKTYHNLEKEVQNEHLKKQADKLENERQTAEREKQLAIERTRAQLTEEILYKTLPKSIANRVIQGENRIADHFKNTSVLFADVVGFTGISAKMPPETVLRFMNFLFEHFDSLAEKHGCERIKTIGDGYMAVCGAPIEYDNHAERLAFMALDMMEDIQLPEEIRKHLPTGTVFHLRIGLHCGEITAGLIGTGKLAYDIYGDAVNTAARMESHGEAGKIHVSEEFRYAVSESLFTFTERSEMNIKGKGMMKTYFLEKAQ